MGLRRLWKSVVGMFAVCLIMAVFTPDAFAEDSHPVLPFVTAPVAFVSCKDIGEIISPCAALMRDISRQTYRYGALGPLGKDYVADKEHRRLFYASYGLARPGVLIKRARYAPDYAVRVCAGEKCPYGAGLTIFHDAEQQGVIVVEEDSPLQVVPEGEDTI